MKNYKLSLLHDFGLPGYSFSVAMLLSKGQFEFCKNANIISLVSENLIGGISHTQRRHLMNNSERLRGKLDESKERTEIVALDLVSLYQFSMKSKLPLGSYVFMDESEVKGFNVFELKRLYPGCGFLINLDLQYPNEIKLHSEDFPFVVERVKLKSTVSLPHQREMFLASQPSPATESWIFQIMQTQCDKIGVLLHHRMLFWFLQRGMKVMKLNYIIRFSESKWLEPFIDWNINLRKNSSWKVEQRLCKLIGNTIFGKFFGGYTPLHIRFGISEEESQRLTARPEFSDVKVLSEKRQFCQYFS